MNADSRDQLAEILVSIRNGARPIGNVDMDLSKHHQGTVEALLEATFGKSADADEAKLRELIDQLAEERATFEEWLDDWLGSPDETDMVNVIHDAFLALV